LPQIQPPVSPERDAAGRALQRAYEKEDTYTGLVKELEEHLARTSERAVAVVTRIPFTKISTTERQGFKQCRLAWNFGSYQRQNLEPNRSDDRLWFGTGAHKALDEYYAPKNTINEDGSIPLHGDPVGFWIKWTDAEYKRMAEISGMFTEETDSFNDMRGLGIAVLTNYVKYAEEFDDFEVVMTEQEFEVPIRNPATNEVVGLLVGRFDGIARTRDGRLWLLEHKTSADKLNPNDTLYDDQTTGYLWAAQQVFGQPLEGIYYNVLRKKVPRKPPMLVNGKSLSKAKDIDTTYEVYLDTILENGLDPAQYADILEILKAKGNTFVMREKVIKDSKEIALWGRQLYDEYIDMADNPRIYPNMTFDCSWMCDFKPLCTATRKGDDVRFLIEAGYRCRALDNTTYSTLTPEDAERLRELYNTPINYSEVHTPEVVTGDEAQH
jgi:hypothetical protein